MFVVEFWVCFEHSTHTPRCSMPIPRFFVSEFWVCRQAAKKLYNVVKRKDATCFCGASGSHLVSQNWKTWNCAVFRTKLSPKQAKKCKIRFFRSCNSVSFYLNIQYLSPRCVTFLNCKTWRYATFRTKSYKKQAKKCEFRFFYFLITYGVCKKRKYCLLLHFGLFSYIDK